MYLRLFFEPMTRVQYANTNKLMSTFLTLTNMLVDNIGIEQPKPSVRTCMGNLSINVHSIYFIRYVVTTQLVMSHNFSLILFSSVSLIFWLLIVAGCLKGPE